MRACFAQNFEDILLDRVFQGKPEGFYIDVGAHDPEHLSVTNLFYQKGWTGINIEPVPISLEKFKNTRPKDINLNMALSNQKGEMIFYMINNDMQASLSSFDKQQVAIISQERNVSYGEIKVKVETLENICEEYCQDKEIDFLKIDVEGFEWQVISGANFKKFRPKVILVEATKVNSNPIKVKDIKEIATWDKFEPILLENDYEFVYFDGLNRYYVAKEAADLKHYFSFPIGCFDGFQSFRLFAEYQSQKSKIKELEQQLQQQRSDE